MAVYDGLTRIHNRTFLMAWAEPELARASRMRSPLSLVLFDIDFFKTFNDSFGHEAGDIVLTALAKLVEGNVRKSDVWARWGGEEFLLALPDTDSVDAQRIADGLRLLVEHHHFEYQGKRLHVTVSGGVSTYNLVGPRSIGELVKEADDALYRSKKTGRNRITLFQGNGGL